MDAPDLHAFQRAFGRHVRDPRHAPRPSGVPARRMVVYNELLFNNLCGFIDNCFPVCRATLGEQRWRRLKRAFFRDWPSHTPWFREIPREFVRYLGTAAIRQPLPGWLEELAHYEWVELAVDVADPPVAVHRADGCLASGRPLLNPTLMNLAYQWPVHRIGPDYRPRKKQPTWLLVYRAADDTVRFVAANPVTARLLTLLDGEVDGGLSGRAACQRIAGELQHPAPATLVAHGLTMLEELRRQGAILGTRT